MPTLFRMPTGADVFRQQVRVPRPATRTDIVRAVTHVVLCWWQHVRCFFGWHHVPACFVRQQVLAPRLSTSAIASLAGNTRPFSSGGSRCRFVYVGNMCPRIFGSKRRRPGRQQLPTVSRPATCADPCSGGIKCRRPFGLQQVPKPFRQQVPTFPGPATCAVFISGGHEFRRCFGWQQVPAPFWQQASADNTCRHPVG